MESQIAFHTGPQPHSARCPRPPLHPHLPSPEISPHVTLLILMSNPHILSSLLPYLDWEDFNSFLNCCKHSASLFNNLETRDVILSRYVPWYRHAASLRDAQNGYRDVPVSSRDLDLLLTSQRVPLHQYPIHARRVLASPCPTEESDAVSSWLQSMTEAHSRFVLLLQAYVHSPDVVQAEPEDMAWMSRFRASRGPLRKLTFPAPLSYPNGMVKERGAKNNFHQSQNGRNARTYGTARLTGSKKGRHSTYLDSPAYSRSTQMDYRSWTRLSTISHLSRDPSYTSDDCVSARHTNDFSFDSLPRSHSTSSSSISRNSLHPFTITRSSLYSDTASPSMSPSYPIRMTSPLDLSFAVSRNRAPILRVFVPCSELEVDSHELLMCEQQLMDAGLWDHLSAGDLVCNLGYVPPVEDDDDPSIARRSRRQSQFIYYQRLSQSRRWLLFNGELLVPHDPPDSFCLPDPLSLPTPFYYAHIMPPYTNPIFVIDGLGLEDAKSAPETHLVDTTVKVPSPHSPAGYALVRKYVWTARVLPSLWNSSQMDRFIGKGWMSEWILEGEGTKEGKELLLDCILGKIAGPLEWEVVVERCGGGRVWLRLLSILKRTRDTHPRSTIQCL